MSPSETQELEHRLIKLELLQQHIEGYIKSIELFHQKIEDKMDHITSQINSMSLHEKSISKMEEQVIEHDKKIDKLYTYMKILAFILIGISGGTAGLMKVFVP